MKIEFLDLLITAVANQNYRIKSYIKDRHFITVPKYQGNYCSKSKSANISVMQKVEQENLICSFG